MFQETRWSRAGDSPTKASRKADDDAESTYSRQSRVSRQRSGITDINSDVAGGKKSTAVKKKMKKEKRLLSANLIKNPRKKPGEMAGGNLNQNQLMASQRTRNKALAVDADPFEYGTAKYEAYKAKYIYIYNF